MSQNKKTNNFKMNYIVYNNFKFYEDSYLVNYIKIFIKFDNVIIYRIK